MELWIIRHGDPDYVHDSLTEKGVREAKLLAERLSKYNISKIYCDKQTEYHRSQLLHNG